MRYLTALVLTAALAGVASAQISGEVQSAPTPATGDLLLPIAADSYITNDVVVDAASDWLSAVLAIELTSGDIYQHPAGGNTSPNPILIPAYNALEYDTYVSNGVVGEAVSTAAAADLGYAAIEADVDTFALSWYTTEGDDLGILALVRATLSTDAQGSWQFRATASPAGGPAVELAGNVVDGYMVPEPATMALLGLGGLAALIRRKR